MEPWKILTLTVLALFVVYGFLQIIIKRKFFDFNSKNLGWFYGILGWLCVIFAVFVM